VNRPSILQNAYFLTSIVLALLLCYEVAERHHFRWPIQIESRQSPKADAISRKAWNDGYATGLRAGRQPLDPAEDETIDWDQLYGSKPSDQSSVVAFNLFNPHSGTHKLLKL
jgi:hypothetical protein